MLSTKEKQELFELLEEKENRKIKKDYYLYVQKTHNDYIKCKHGEYISNVINDALDKREAMLRGDIPTENQYLMFSLPPRHGKSWHITETLPSYTMSKYDNFKVILTAYSSTLAFDFADANAKKIKEHNIFGVSVVKNNQERLTLDNGSECVKAGILGGITGKGANLLIIDDPIKTAEEARSEVHRRKVWREWEMSLSTRLEEAAIVIVIMTRWHEDDLCGRLLNKEYAEPLNWKVINLPIEAEENDVLGREVGQPLWAERYGYDFIKERKRYPESFNALYQGRPTSQEGNMLKRESWQFYEYRDEFINTLPTLILSVDASFKGTNRSDNVSIQVWGKKKAFYYLVHEKTERMTFTATIQNIVNILKRYPRISSKYVEDKANGSAIIDVLNIKIGGFIPVRADMSTGGKVARVSAIEPWITSKNVFLPRGAAFTHDFIEECAAFPNGAHDDRVDAMSQALNQLIYAFGDIDKPTHNIDDFFTKKDPKDEFYDDFIEYGFD